MKRQNGFFSVSRACFVALPVIILTACAGGTLDGKEHNHETTLAADLVTAGVVSEKNYSLEEMPVPLQEIVMSDMTTQAGNRTIRILLVMTEGEYTTEAYEASAGGVYPENFRGSYELRTLTEQGDQIDCLVLTDESGEHEFNFGGEFALALEDYNQDGCPDFTLGTWGSSSMGIYYLYTVTESGKIEQAYPDGIAGTGFAFSKALEQTAEPGFAVSLYNQADGSSNRIVYAWEENPEEFSGSYVPVEESALPQSGSFVSIGERLKAGTARIVSFGELETLQKDSGAVLLGELPERECSIYGYAGPENEYQGIWIQDKEGQLHAFESVPYTSPQLEPPEFWWYEEQDILEAAFHTLTGTALSADQLFLFIHSEDGRLELMEFTKEECEKHLRERLTYEIEEEADRATFFDYGREIAAVSLEGLDGNIQDVVYTDFVRYRINGEVMMTFKPGFMLDGMATPQYSESPDWGMEAELWIIRTDSGEEPVTIEIGDIRQANSNNNINPQTVPSQEEPEEPTQESIPNTEKSLSSDGQEMKRIAEEFATAYFNKDTDSIQSFLSDPFEWDIEVYAGTGTISEVSLKGLTDIGEKENGSVQTVSAEYIDSNLGDSYHYLTLEFIKQENEWKIQFYGIDG